MKIQLVDLNRQHAPIRKEIDEAIDRVIRNSSFILGVEVERFERDFSEWCGSAHAVGCASGTDALYLALKALDIGPGDEVVTVSYTFMATVGAIERTGARPVLVDILPDTYTMNPDAFKAVITEKTKAVIPVHLYGQAAYIDRIAEIAGERGIAVIEDCAQAHGATLKGRKVGTFGRIGCFSFFPSKNLGAMGDGGICVTDDAEIAERLRRIRVHGRGTKHESFEKGDNSRLDGLQAAILSVKLPHLDEWNESRRRAARLYDEAFGDLEGVSTPFTGPEREHVYHLYVIRVERRDAVMRSLKEAGIASGVHYPIPVHLMRGFANLGYKEGSLPVSESSCGTILSLPMYPGITGDEVTAVVEAVKRGLAG